jgi:nitroimidazol reductase NimA-like FMN-containing flavoprotein (pyridoxamine 5'-phosphate oxidase superfamily)
MRLTRAEAEFIKWERVCRVATASPRGVPHVVPVCHVLIDGKIYFASESKAKKVKNLEANPHASLAFDLYSDGWGNLKGLMIEGTARFLNRARFRVIRRQLYQKYPQYPAEAALGEGDSVIVEVTPRKKFSWGFE